MQILSNVKKKLSMLSKVCICKFSFGILITVLWHIKKYWIHSICLLPNPFSVVFLADSVSLPSFLVFSFPGMILGRHKEELRGGWEEFGLRCHFSMNGSAFFLPCVGLPLRYPSS
jgi:hypothetical protein